MVRVRLSAGTPPLGPGGTGWIWNFILEQVANGGIHPGDSHHVPRLTGLVVHWSNNRGHRPPDAGNRLVRLRPRVAFDLVESLEEGVVLVEGYHRALQTRLVAVIRLGVDGARLAREVFEALRVHTIAEANDKEVFVAVGDLSIRDGTRGVAVSCPFAVRHQNVGCVTSRAIVLLVRVVHELERPFKPVKHVCAFAGAESIDKSGENLLKLRHGTGQGGEIGIGTCVAVELDNTDKIGKRGRVEHGLRRLLEHVDAIVFGHATRGVQD
mmetsp:Transcript_6741/g.22486  ORF Transcript_6741/g.22486 Transcript_6741/m.22486 type:complete len:268 (+) Transcript_6741:617-1420(+)